MSDAEKDSQAPEEEQEPEEPRTFLTQQQLEEGLSIVQRTADGTSYAFSNLNLEEKEIQELGELLRPYKHLTNVNLSKNDLRDVSEVRHLTYILTLNASTNSVKDISFIEANPDCLEYLQVRQHPIITATVPGPYHQQSREAAQPEPATPAPNLAQRERNRLL